MKRLQSAQARRQEGARSMSAPGQVRIIGGQWRSRLVRFPQLPDLRPTPDRVRVTLFNWLGQDLTGMRCLDLFAGSGALAFEALSRNAREVVVVERDAEARAALAGNAAALGASQRLWVGGTDALQFLDGFGAGATGNFDLVFLDPPFNLGWHERLWPRVGDAVCVSGLIYVESESAFTPPSGWRTWKSGRAGAVHHQLVKREPANE